MPYNSAFQTAASFLTAVCLFLASFHCEPIYGPAGLKPECLIVIASFYFKIKFGDLNDHSKLLVFFFFFTSLSE